MSFPVDDAEMVEELYDEKDDLELNEWEQGFMDSLFIKFEEEGDSMILSDKQVGKLLVIYQKHFN